jgi:hypothetical protein
MHLDLHELLPKAVMWAERQSSLILCNGAPLNSNETELAVRMGVTKPHQVRILVAPEFPRPEDPQLFAFAERAGFFKPEMHGLTLGHGVFIRDGYRANRLVSHECRHVYQYEQHGSIEAFLRVYFAQITQFGYSGAPLEMDAYANETDA